jgi:hypothetical protein
MAFGAQTIQDAGGAVSDLFAGFGAQTQANLKAQGLQIQAQGDIAEGQNYDLAATLAGQNAQFTEASTAIKEAQISRQVTQTIGGQQAEVSGAGFGSSGSALDLMRDSASQGALTKAVAGQQGLIQTASYQEQQQSYETMSAAAKATAAGLENIASETEAAGKMTEFGDIASGLFKGAASIASLALAPVTGGASVALGLAGTSAMGDPTGSGGLY